MNSRYAYYIAILSFCYVTFRAVEDGEWVLALMGVALIGLASALAFRARRAGR